MTTTKLIGVSTGTVVATFATCVVIGAAWAEIEDRQKKAAANGPKYQTAGPKVEKIRNPIRRHRTYKKFEDIVDKY
ncbi:membrane protein [Arthrobacter phage Zeina]|nr:membrane protein [Arthrobacter phage Zeina]